MDKLRKKNVYEFKNNKIELNKTFMQKNNKANICLEAGNAINSEIF
jgi:hypothetical protein